MNDGYEIDPLEKKQRVPDLDTLGELARAGAIHAGTLIRDIRTRKMFLAGDHPYLKDKVRPAPDPPRPVAPPPQPLSAHPLAQNVARMTAPEPITVRRSQVPAAQQFAFDEMTRQYRTLVYWQIAGLVILLDGPILLIFLLLTPLYQLLMLATVAYPVLLAFLPTFALGGLVYALFRKPTLRQSVAAMQVDALAWARPMEKPLRVFWISTAAFTGIVVVFAILVSAVNGVKKNVAEKQEEEETRRAQQINQQNSPTLYRYDFQDGGRGDGEIRQRSRSRSGSGLP